HNSHIESNIRLQRNRSRCIPWYHRKWCVTRYAAQIDISRELELCNTMLQADERNFHCWGYRRWVASVAHVSTEAELAFTLACIQRNFSNYSAWHYRSGVLAACGMDASAMVTELELLQAAMFTEPDDQSAWFYHRWLLDAARKLLASSLDAAAVTPPTLPAPVCTLLATLLKHTAALEELVAAEPAAKWPKLAIAHIFTVLSQVMPALRAAAADEALVSALRTDASTAAAAALLQRVTSDAACIAATVKHSYVDAARVDPMHTLCYSQLAASAAQAGKDAEVAAL
ncbi:MAG: hypothetical protein EOO41_03655, partial [Methanobacteriota archaeon]